MGENREKSRRTNMSSSLLPSGREAAWLGVGVACGAAAIKLLSSDPARCALQPPSRIFKLATASEVKSFEMSGNICSSLDKADGFIHLSDRTSPPKVADLFFNGAKDLHLLEIDASKLEGPVSWVAGVMGDGAPPS